MAADEHSVIHLTVIVLIQPPPLIEKKNDCIFLGKASEVQLSVSLIASYFPSFQISSLFPPPEDGGKKVFLL